jgi:hypothetical protein
MKNKKAQLGIVSLIIGLVMFLLIWFIWLSKFINECGQAAIDNNGLTGLEAFFFSNLNLVIALCLFLALFAWATFGGQQ